MDTVRITHFSDLLCVWAYVSQIRCDELLAAFPDRCTIETRYLHVFGDVAGKMAAAWSSKGGIEAYAAHVREIGSQFEHVTVHPRVWIDGTPASSMPAHLLLCAVRVLEQHGDAQAGASARVGWALREAFFARCENISEHSLLLGTAEACGVPAARLEAALRDGRAHAVLAADMELARDQSIRSSPTLIFNEGRQRLAGNVGYRILEANVRELLERPTSQQSWC